MRCKAGERVDKIVSMYKHEEERTHDDPAVKTRVSISKKAT
jgi:hypothetical protein